MTPGPLREPVARLEPTMSAQQRLLPRGPARSVAAGQGLPEAGLASSAWSLIPGPAPRDHSGPQGRQAERTAGQSSSQAGVSRGLTGRAGAHSLPSASASIPGVGGEGGTEERARRPQQ